RRARGRPDVHPLLLGQPRARRGSRCGPEGARRDRHALGAVDRRGAQPLIRTAPRAVFLMLLAAAPLAAQSPPALNPAPSDTAVAYFVSGGAWQTGHSHGYYRLLVAREGARRVPSRLLIEWIETTPEHAFVRLFRVVSVITEPWQLR